MTALRAVPHPRRSAGQVAEQKRLLAQERAELQQEKERHAAHEAKAEPAAPNVTAQ